jgi:hypothetical protein
MSFLTETDATVVRADYVIADNVHSSGGIVSAVNSAHPALNVYGDGATDSPLLDFTNVTTAVNTDVIGTTANPTVGVDATGYLKVMIDDAVKFIPFYDSVA